MDGTIKKPDPNKVSQVWRHFDQFDHPMYSMYAKCKLCQATKSLKSPYRKRQSLVNLKRHLQSSHWDVYSSIYWKPYYPNINDIPIETAEIIATYLDGTSFINASLAIPVFARLASIPRHYRKLIFLSKNRVLANDGDKVIAIDDDHGTITTSSSSSCSSSSMYV